MQAGQDDDPILEALLGYPLFAQGSSKLGWLMNLNEVHTSNFSGSGVPKHVCAIAAILQICDTGADKAYS